MEKKKLTSANGRLIADNQNTQTAGQRGPIMMQDPWFLEKLAHFDREVIPERRMHAKGSGAGDHAKGGDCLQSLFIDVFQLIRRRTHA